MPQHEGGPFGGAQFVHGLGHPLADFAAQGHAVRRGVVRGQREHGIVHFGIGRRHLFAAPFAGAHQVQRAVHRDAVQPRAEAGAFVEFAELSVGPQEAFLHHVLGVLFIASHTKSQPEQSTAMAFHQHPVTRRHRPTALW